jgi:Zn-dependent M28 family amino/carboxypeptidase
LSDSRIASGQAPNTIEFHWYAGEEAGLLGSGAIFNQYKREGRIVKAMLNQDMTGYVKPGTKAVAGIITDNVDAGLSAFLKKVIAAVSKPKNTKRSPTNLTTVLFSSYCRLQVWLRLLRPRFCYPSWLPCGSRF